MLIHTTGDLFTQPAQAFAHGCNCQGVMGAGIAHEFRRRYPAMFSAYRSRCLAVPRQFNPGDAWLWQQPGLPGVFNLATQEYYGRQGRARLDWLTQSLIAMCRQADVTGITTIALPMIGAGLGGLDQGDVRATFEHTLGQWSGTATLVTR